MKLHERITALETNLHDLEAKLALVEYLTAETQPASTQLVIDENLGFILWAQPTTVMGSVIYFDNFGLVGELTMLNEDEGTITVNDVDAAAGLEEWLADHGLSYIIRTIPASTPAEEGAFA